MATAMPSIAMAANAAMEAIHGTVVRDTEPFATPSMVVVL
jgi:hypothetical protein